MDYGIGGKTAVVTGGDSGMGKAVAKMLLEEGARVLVADKFPDALERTTAELAAFGEVHGAVLDVTKAASVAALKTVAVERFGTIDFLVHAAGVTGPTGVFHDIDDDAWQEALDIILMGAVRTVRAFAPDMAARGSGRIVLFGSEDAEQPYPDELPYCAAKAGILNLAKGLSKTYARHGVLVNTVSPAYIATPMTDAMMAKRAAETGTSFETAIESFLREERPHLELERRGLPEEVAALVVFLCSRHASFINGANYRVDGGSVATV